MSILKSTRRYHILIGSFLVAASLWFSVTMGNLYRAQIEVPLAVTSMPRDIALSRPLPATISVLVEASGWQLLFLNAGKPITFEIPGEALRRGVILTNRVLAEMMKMPAGIQAIRAYPDTLFISIDRFTEKKVPLRVTAISMSFKDGFGLVRAIDVQPDSVVLKGAENVLDGITSWPLEARSYPDLAMPVAEEVPLLDSLRGVLRFSVDKATVYIPTEQLAEMLFEDVPIQIREKPEHGEVLLAQKSISILVRGGVNVLANLSADDFRVQVDFEDLVADTSGTFIPTIILPAGLHLLKIEPAEVRYTLRR
jgi:YbbR domain-containing protein